MCDIHPHGRLGWKGWRTLPACSNKLPEGKWQDLSYVLDAAMPTPRVFPKPKIERVASMPGSHLNLTRLELVCHVGTHIDAPAHLFMDGPGIDAIPWEYLHGPAVVWNIEVDPLADITPEMLARMQPAVRPGEMVFLHTGWQKLWGSEEYYANPALTPEAGQWLVDQGVKLLGVDTATPDQALPARSKDFDWPVHKILLSNGTLIAENVAGLGPLVGRRVEVVIGALAIRGSDGSPARIAARATVDGGAP